MFHRSKLFVVALRITMSVIFNCFEKLKNVRNTLLMVKNVSERKLLNSIMLHRSKLFVVALRIPFKL
jgi:hypothetical protein